MNDRRSVTVSDDQNLRLQPCSAIHVWPHEIGLRVVCHSSVISALIGFNGSVISKLRDDTGTKIHIETPVNGSGYGIVFIAGSRTIDKSILLTDGVGDFTGGEQEDWVTYNVSAAQVALIRVLERSWTFLAEQDEEAFCGILADRTQIGAVEMRRETDAIIRVLPHPTCGTKTDVLIQITGDVLSVKKAVVMVSRCLQDCPPINGYPRPLHRAYDSSSDVDLYSGFFPNLRSLLPPLSSYNALEAASCRHLSSVDTERKVVFRLICTKVAAGGIIGKKGTIIRALENETGVAIRTKATFKHDERLVTISAIEKLESQYSPAQDALILVFARTVENDIENGLIPGFHNGTALKARLLVPSQFANGFNANNKEIIATGAELHVSVGQQIMDWVSEHQSTIEIKGNFKQVQEAMLHITSKLRDNLLPKELPDKVRARVSNPNEVARPSHISNPKPSQNATRGNSFSILDGEQDINMVRTGPNLVKSNDDLMHTDVFKEGGTARIPSVQENDLTQGMKQLQLSSNLERSKGISLKNLTLELAIERDALVALYGIDGAGLDHLRQMTGAEVDVRDHTRSEITVVISGSPDQTSAAMSWIVSILDE